MSLVVTIPAAVFCGAINYILRMSGFWDYDLTSTQKLYSLSVSVDQASLVSLMKQYLQHRTSTFQLLEDIQFEPGPLFHAREQLAMHDLRLFLDVLGLIGVICVLLVIVAYFLLIRWRSREEHMKYFKKSLIVYGAVMVVTAVINLIPFLRHHVWALLTGHHIKTADLLDQIFGTQAMGMHLTMFLLLSTGVVMAALTYITWEIAGRKRIFGQID